MKVTVIPAGEKMKPGRGDWVRLAPFEKKVLRGALSMWLRERSLDDRKHYETLAEKLR